MALCAGLASLVAFATLGCALFERGESWGTTETGAITMDSDPSVSGSGSGAGSGSGSSGSLTMSGTDDGSGSSTGDPAPSFAAEVHEPLLADCQRCHSSTGTASTSAYLLTGIVDADYESTLEWVDLDRPGQSALLSMSAGQGHGGGSIYPAGSPAYLLLVTWIEAGAAP